MTLRDNIKKYNIKLDQVLSKNFEDYNYIYNNQQTWLCNLEDKTNLLKSEDTQLAIKRVIQKLKSNSLFSANDTSDLSAYISNINRIVNIGNRINNFKEGTLLIDGTKLSLFNFFNLIKNTDNLNLLKIELNNNLKSYLPHLFSVIKHSQNPKQFPIHYKFWKNILREVLNVNDEYDDLCNFYRTFPEENRHLIFGSYLGTIGLLIGKNIKNDFPTLIENSKDYKYITDDIINIDPYQSAFKSSFTDNNIEVTPDKINKAVMNNPLNQILYGPPGTGKTYNTVLEAAKIVTGNEYISYDEALKIFNSNLGSQIEFITFHQNYSYEDFIQGLRPDTENGSALTFEKKDGVFKRIADRAYLNLKASENNQIAKQSFKEVFNNYIKSFVEGDVDEIEVKMIKTSYFITDISEKNISFRKNSGGTGHTLSLTTLEKMYNEENTGEIQGLSSYYEPLLKLLLEKGKANQNSKIIKQNFVIIIDEINRANISRVFGELITLIEEDKRSHGKIPMRVTLPSGDTFIVPSNLHIIGTMNTADKSIALLDIALRRRFEFVPMYPNINLENVNDREILAAINKAILDRKNHDFTIGHAYFMGDDYSRVKTINNKVIPLLLEYFMNDEKEVIAILKAADLTIGDWPLKLL